MHLASPLRFVFVAYIEKSGLFGIELKSKIVNAVPEPIMLPITFNDDIHVVALFIIVFPPTCNLAWGVIKLIPILPLPVTGQLPLVKLNFD